MQHFKSYVNMKQHIHPIDNIVQLITQKEYLHESINRIIERGQISQNKIIHAIGGFNYLRIGLNIKYRHI